MTTKKTKQAGAENVPFAVIQEAWNALYRLGDEALERMRAADAKSDLDAVFEAQRSFEKVVEALSKFSLVSDVAIKGRVFANGGKKKGAYSPVKKWIERQLKKNIDLKPAELWAMLKEKPLHGWKIVEPRFSKIEKFIEAPTSGDDMPYKRFQDAVSEVKRDLKKSAT